MKSNKARMAPNPPLLFIVIKIKELDVGSWMEVCEELRKQTVDVCCLQELRWRNQGARFLGVEERRFNF